MESLTRRLRRARPAVHDAFDKEIIRRHVFCESDHQPTLGQYELLRRLGQGAMGVVYEARNIQRGELVALKALRAQDPNTLSLIKREFRALADLHHENLCTLHELHIEGGTAYFTMELVRGRDFLSHVWDIEPHAYPPEKTFADFTRVRAVLRQIIAGLGVLHQAGKVHRDIKPSNVLVGHDGRVTVLDFGLIVTTEQPPDSTLGHVVGTPLYMAPEQLNASALSAASDWYAVGTMLYHALVGHAPCEGLSVAEIRARKCAGAPPRPSEVCPGISDELDDLVHDLLQPDPAARPTGDEVLERLGWQPPRTLRASRPRTDEQDVFVGRERELAQLDGLLKQSRTQSVAVVVTGPTGVGKTALMRRFLDDLDPRRHVILAARCHERESISHKVLDGVVDALARYLRKLPLAIAGRLMPRHVHELARLFPALQRVEAVMKAPRGTSSKDKHELLRRAIAALRELLARIGDEASLVIWVDDLQWGDVDSMVFIKQILGAQEAPAGLFMGTYTGKHDRVMVPFERIVSVARANGSTMHAERIDVQPLPSEDASTLAHALLPPEAQVAAADVALETGGNPLLIRRFALFMSSTGTAVHLGADTFDDMIRKQVNALSPVARELLRVVAVARSAIEQRVAIAAARIASSATAAIAELRRSSLIRTEGSLDRGFIEIDHMRLANAVTMGLDRHGLHDLHARIAGALVQFNSTDHERVARHLSSTGERAQATHYLLRAAEQAAQSVAFERAARLYGTALSFGVAENERAKTEAALGDALNNAGRSREAADAYQRAVRTVGLPHDARVELKRKAAQALLFCGMYDRAQPLIDELCREVDVKLPGSRAGAIATLVLNRTYQTLRGLRYARRPPGEVLVREAARADTYWMLGQGLVIVDPVRGTSFLNRTVRASLRCGDPARVARALSFEAVTAAYPGESARARADHYQSAARAAAEAAQDPYSRTLVDLSSAMIAFFVGDPVVGAREAKLVEQDIREHCVGAHWELNTAAVTATSCYMQLGRWRPFVTQCKDLLEEALACGNLYRSVGIRLHTHHAKLVLDDVPAARAEVDSVARDWPYQGFDMQHLAIAGGPARILLYEGDGAAAYRRMCDVWPHMARSMMLRANVVHVEALALRGRAAAVAYAQSREQAARSGALSTARKLERVGGFGARPSALVIRASIAHSDGRIERAEALLRDADRQYQAGQALSFAAMVRYLRGQILGGKTGAVMMRESEHELREDRIVNIPAFIRLHTGFPVGADA